MKLNLKLLNMFKIKKKLLCIIVALSCTIQVFASSGIYIRGGMNSWAASADWEFVDEGNGVYTLTDKVVYGDFKIADANWSSSCNYGASNGNIMLDSTYELSSGENPDNISCGSNTYTCTKITLTIPTEGNATLLLQGNNDDSNLTEVYVIGDNNSWDFMDASGKLSATATEGEFKGTVTMTASLSTATYCYWRIYQRLGMGGAWGAVGGLDTTEDITNGILEKGSTGCITTLPGTYTVTFSTKTGNFSLEKLPSIATSMLVLPTEVTLVPKLPDAIKILSLNNSLIDYNDQNLIFNEIAKTMNKNASWTKHTLLGKTLNYHYNEGEGLAEDGTPSAKMMVRSEAWTHIILQEQGSLPSTNIDAFRNSIKIWKEYIRENCPNPNAIIIIPMNWAFSGDWDNFKANNYKLYESYMEVAQEFGVILCPVQKAYESILDAEGAEQCNTLYSDDRHPTHKATYLAACMEYSIIFNEDASSITYCPTTVNNEDAQKMRQYASNSIASFDNIIDHFTRKVKFSSRIVDQYGQSMSIETPTNWSKDSGTLDANHVFTADANLGKYTVTATNGAFTTSTIVTVAEAIDIKKDEPALEVNDNTLIGENFNSIGVEATATLPYAWRIDKQTGLPRTVGLFSMAVEKTEQSGGNSLASNAKNGIYNFGAGDLSTATDRALGGISTGVDGGTRCINVYTHIRNTGISEIKELNIAYDIEKYRKGNNVAGFAAQLYYSTDGTAWFSAGNDFYTLFAADSSTEGYNNAPGDSKSVNSKLNISIAAGKNLYLAWNLSVASGTAANGAQALALDNVVIDTSTVGVELNTSDEENISLTIANAILKATAKSEVIEIKVYEINGAIVASSNSKELNISNLSKGIYIIAINTANTTKTFKIVR